MKRSMICVAVLCFLLLGTQAAFAAGFEVAEVSGRQMGNAYAGKAASAEDASTVFFNPAAMMKIETFNVVGSFEVLSTGGEWTDKGSNVSGSDGGDPGDVSILPDLYFVAPLSDRWAVGIGFTTPFGLKTEYDEDWQGRYHAVKSELSVLDFMAAVAFRLNSSVSLGIGIDYQIAQAELSNMVDYGTIFQLPGGAGSADGLATLDSDASHAVGFSASILAELTEWTRFGLTWRSQVEHTLRGDATFEKPFLSSAPVFQDTKGEAELTLPMQVYFSFYHDFNEKWAILADITWTGWSSFEELRIDFDNPNQPASVQEENWNDVWRFSVGTTFRPTPDWALRFGLAYDQSPIEDEYRTARIPTNDRFWIALGVGYAVTEFMVIDLSYMHVFIESADMNDTVATGQNLRGSFDGSADVLALQFTFTF